MALLVSCCAGNELRVRIWEGRRIKVVASGRPHIRAECHRFVRYLSSPSLQMCFNAVCPRGSWLDTTDAIRVGIVGNAIREVLQRFVNRCGWGLFRATIQDQGQVFLLAGVGELFASAAQAVGAIERIEGFELEQASPFLFSGRLDAVDLSSLSMGEP